MDIAIGADHGGFQLKAILLEYLRNLGHSVQDLGALDSEPSDYPDYARAVANALIDGRAERGILICGSGVGASVAANKIPGIRAGVCHDCYSAHQGVEHDNMNVLVLGSRVIALALAQDLASVFLKATFSGEERHLRRVGKIQLLEKKYR